MDNLGQSGVYLYCPRQHASEYQLLAITVGERAVVLMPGLPASHRHLVGCYENKRLDQMGHRPNPAGLFLIFLCRSIHTRLRPLSCSLKICLEEDAASRPSKTLVCAMSVPLCLLLTCEGTPLKLPSLVFRFINVYCSDMFTGDNTFHIRSKVGRRWKAANGEQCAFNTANKRLRTAQEQK